MNSRALVKTSEQSWMERALGARGARALLAAGGTGILILSVPTTLLEHLSTASGISDLLPFLAPPLGVRARIAIAAVLALVVVAIVYAFWGRGLSASKKSPPSGWSTLVRLVRGETDAEAEPSEDMLSRRRRDRHPDAPPRPPLSASRDLPPPFVPELDDHNAPEDAAPPRDAFASLSHILEIARAPAQLVQPATADLLPRSPEPMSDAEIAQTIATIPAIATIPEREAEAPVANPTRWSGIAADLPLIEDADIAVLATRFERGIAKRETVLHAETAQSSLDSRIAFVQPDPAVRDALRSIRPIEIVATPAFAEQATDPSPDATTLRVDADVEAALNRALATLRKLAEQGRR